MERDGLAMRRNFVIAGFALVVAIAVPVLVGAALWSPSGVLAAFSRQAGGAPTVVTYQGYLTDSGGNPLDGQVDIWFRIYATESSMDILWEEFHDNVPVTDGYFTALLGSEGSALTASVFDQTERWLQMSVDTGGSYSDLPRQRIAAVPFAFQAQKAASVDAVGCRVVSTATQSIPHNTLTPLVFTTEIDDTSGCWSPSNPTRLVAQTSGYYLAGGALTFAAGEIDAAARVAVGIQRNGTTFLQFDEVHTNPGKTVGISVSTGMVYMDAGDYVQVLAFQDLGGARDTLERSDPSIDQHVVNGWLVKVGD